MTLPMTGSDDPGRIGCRTFFEMVETSLGGRYDRPTRREPGGQCVVDFFHPRAVERLGTEGLATRFNRSGLVWAPPADRLAVQLRVPAAHDEAVTAALADAPVAFERTDHRGVAASDGEVVTMLHYSVRTGPVARDDLVATLDAVGAALVV